MIDYAKYMQDELEGAMEYCELSKQADNPNVQRMFKDMAMTELSHFDKLHALMVEEYSAIKSKLQ